MKILITNTVALNGGDCAILYSLIDLLRQVFGEKTEFTVYDNAPDVARRYHPDIRFRELLYIRARKSFRRIKGSRFLPNRLILLRFYFGAWCWRNRLRFLSNAILTKAECEDLELYQTADLIVSTGGTYLVEDYSLTSRIFDFKISLLMNKPLVLFTQSLGPFRNEPNRRQLRKIFEKSLLIFVRDKTSHNHLEDLNIDMRKVSIFPDVVFASIPELIGPEMRDDLAQRQQSLHIAISVRHWRHFKNTNEQHGMERYIEVMRDIVAHLVRKHSARVTFISTCQGIPEYWLDDSKVAEKIYSGLTEEVKTSIHVDNRFHTPGELTRFLASVDIVISTRMHMAILALIAGTPVMPIAYEFKTIELFKRLGMGKWTQDIETIDGDSFINSLDSFLEQTPNICEVISKRIPEEKNLVLRSGKKVKDEYEKKIGLSR
ncbi:MAG: polysaccharide pyruvyl transferase family protein [Deltaproteobacteria bacterium]|nr:polysaccharide pyruvyl transferase family protein [Deltaproteobacteria bacterium]